MNYKRSHYNVVVEDLEGNKKLIYNTYSGIYGIMDSDAQLLYNNIENIEINDITNEKEIKNFDIMKKAGYIIPRDTDELATIKLKRQRAKYQDNMLVFTIAPTLDCNMCCPYCYEEKKQIGNE